MKDCGQPTFCAYHSPKIEVSWLSVHVNLTEELYFPFISSIENTVRAVYNISQHAVQYRSRQRRVWRPQC